MFEDKTLKCKECGADFIFTAGEQEFYAEKVPASSSLLPALPAAARPEFRLSRSLTVLSTAASASRR